MASLASLASKDGVFLVRFRYAGREYKKSLKTRSRDDAKAAVAIVEVTIHRLLTGQITAPLGVDRRDFIVSGGTLTAPAEKPAEETPTPPPPFAELMERYLAYQELKIAESYRASQAIHLRHLKRHLGSRADLACDCITQDHLDSFIQARSKIRDASTVCRERNTLRQFFRWAVAKKHLEASPAEGLEPIKAGVDLPRFHTVAEVEQILKRGGLTDEQASNLWNCIYLAPEEIADLLKTVREKAAEETSFMLHAIPAYTGMRRGELLRLRWVDVDFDHRCVTARSRKQSRTRKETSRQIDMHPYLRQELFAWRAARPKGQFVICDKQTLEPYNADKANRNFWQPMRGTTWCLDSAKNHFKIGFHTYRHSFASNLAALGVDQRIIDEWMGHQTEEMRKRYRHLFPKSRRSAIERLSFAAAMSEDKQHPSTAQQPSSGPRKTGASGAGVISENGRRPGIFLDTPAAGS